MIICVLDQIQKGKAPVHIRPCLYNNFGVRTFRQILSSHFTLSCKSSDMMCLHDGLPFELKLKTAHFVE